eukprot:227981-Pelagomonas_calceolata.AAC.1
MNAITAPSFHPMDVVEHPSHFTIIAELCTLYIDADAPGMTPEDVRIEFQDGMLKVSGEKKGGGQQTEEHAGGRSTADILTQKLEVMNGGFDFMYAKEKLSWLLEVVEPGVSKRAPCD